MGQLLTVLVVAACVTLLWRGRRFDAAIVAVAALGALALERSLKLVFGRDRPDVVDWLVPVSSQSFPSGHALASATIYGVLAVVLARELSARGRAMLFTAASALALLIAGSRPYLGVHYPSDVIAGLLIGVIWSVACLGGMGLARSRREARVEG